MPELPEVERARSLLAEVAEGVRIADIETFEDTIVYSGCDYLQFADAFRGRTIDKVLRVGKQLYFTTRDGPTGLVHLGMSGHTFVKGAAEQLYYRKLRAKDLDENGQPLWPPRYCKLILRLDGGIEWAFTDARRLGRLRLVEQGTDPLSVPPLSLLGRDAYNDLPTFEELSIVLAKRTAPIKALLLDQNGPLAGIGNYLIDEIDFQARIHPAQRASTLDEAQRKELYKQIKEVIGTAVSLKADYRAFPKNWIFSVRWGKGKRGEAPAVTLDNGDTHPISFATVGGRTTAFVPALQKIPKGASAAEAKPGKAKGSPGKRKKPNSARSSDESGSDQDVEDAVVHDEPSNAANIVVADEKPTRITPKRGSRKPSSAGGKSPYFEHSGDDGEEDQHDIADGDVDVKPAKRRRTHRKTAKDVDEPVEEDKKVVRPRRRSRTS